MVALLKFFANFINNIHDFILQRIPPSLDNLTDKKLHFIFMAIIGIIIFSITQFAFKRIAKYSITAISFIYTFTVMVVIVFAIEIQQKLTHRGNMEFSDIIYGIYGFLYVFVIYLIIKGLHILIKKYIFKK